MQWPVYDFVGYGHFSNYLCDCVRPILSLERTYSPLVRAAIICSTAALARSVTPEASRPPKG